MDVMHDFSFCGLELVPWFDGEKHDSLNRERGAEYNNARVRCTGF